MPELVHTPMGHAHCTSGAPPAPRSPQSGLGLQRPSYRGVPSCVQGALRKSCLWRGYVPEGWDLHDSAHFFTMAGYPATTAESEMYISQLLFTI